MKHFIAILVLFYCVISIDSFSCPGSVPTISGPPEVEVNAVVQYTHVFDAGYRNSSGGYFGSQWSINGKGVVGYGESPQINFSGLTVGVSYTLTVKDQFGSASACYGCISNTTFTKTITIVPYRPDFKVEILSAIPTTVTECSETQTLSFKVTNIGSAAAPKTTAKVFWTNGPNEFLSQNEVIPANPVGGFFHINNAFFRKPCITPQSETWNFVIFADPDNLIVEKDETNNKATKTGITVSKGLGGRIAQNTGSTASLISVSDSFGKIVWKNGASAFDFSSLKNGMYIYKYQEGQSIVTQKVVKQ
jgi:hypothetical protein